MTHLKVDDSLRVLVRSYVYKVTITIILLCSIIPLILWHMRCIDPVLNDCKYSIWWLNHKNYNNNEYIRKIKNGNDITNLNWMLENRKKSEPLNLLARRSFCTSKETEMLGFLSLPFPLQLNTITEEMLWVWDASFSDTLGAYISILLVDNDICPYNRTRFLSERSDFMKDRAKENLKAYLNSTSIPKDSLKSKIFCRYYDKRSHLLGTVVSTKVLATTKDEYYAKQDINNNDKNKKVKSFKNMKNIYVVRCPVPIEYRDKSPLQLRMQIPPFSPLLTRAKDKNKFTNKGRQLLQIDNNPDTKQVVSNGIVKKQGNQIFAMTQMFPICPFAVKRKATDLPQQRLYNISLCTTLKNDMKEEVVEWIEQHRILGVEHVFMFDSRIKVKNSKADDDSDEYQMDKILNKYVESGILTLIPWYFSNCEDTSTDSVEKVTAESSCFLRFRSASQWIGFMPINEIIAIKIDHSVGGSVLTDLPNFINFVERKTKGDLSAIGFHKLPLVKCSDSIIIDTLHEASISISINRISKNQKDEEEMEPLPRLGTRRHVPSINKLAASTVGIDTKSKGYLLKMDAILTAIQNDFILLDDNLGHRLGLGGRRNEDGEGYTIGDGAVFLRKISYISGKDITFQAEEGAKSTDITYTIAEIAKDVGVLLQYLDDGTSEKVKSITCGDKDSTIEQLSTKTTERVKYRMSLALEGIISEYINRN